MMSRTVRIALLATVFVYAAELNPVRAQHLWPPSIFTVGLTEKDRAVLNAEVEAELRAPHQSLSIGYDESGADTGHDQAKADGDHEGDAADAPRP